MSGKRKAYVIEVFSGGTKLNKILGMLNLILLTFFFCYVALSHSGDYILQSANGIVAGFYLLPVIFIAGFYGYYISFIIFLFAFCLTLAFNRDNAYSMVIYMAVILCISLCSQYRYFKSILKTIYAATITFAVVTFNYYLCFYAIDNMNYSIKNLYSNKIYSYKELIAIYGTAFFFFIFYNYAPDSYKQCFPLGVVYLEEFETNEELQRRLRKTKVSMKITGSIVGVEVLLGISVAFFMMVLFPDIKRLFLYRGMKENPDFVAAAKLVTDLNNIDFKIDGAMISFDLKMIMLLLCVGVPIAAIANFITKSYIAGPLGDLANFFKDYAYASDEDKKVYGHKIDDIYIKTNDEFEVMYDNLRTTVYEMEAFIKRMEEKRKLETELEVAKKSSEAKSSFLSNMSHEIRTPINAVLGMNEMILRESHEPQTLQYANNIKSAGNSLLSLVNDILDFSKIEAGKMEIIPAQYQLGSTINDLINMIQSKADEKGLKLELYVNEHTPSLLIGDELRLKQCVTNLLTNAVKYTEEGLVRMDVDFEKVDDNSINLRFTVSDTGIGIKEEDLSKLYSPFERIEEIRNRTIEGTGLGMSIVKKLLALMDTKMVVSSVYGEGSTFSFSVNQQVVSWEEIGDFKSKYKEYIADSDTYHQRFQAPTAVILVVDDTEMNLTVIKSLLKQTLVQVDTAESGFETLDKVTETKYDIIFLDHRMPNMDGIETFEAMKTLEGNLNSDTPVIALTANAVSGAKEEYVSHGFTDYLSKPVNGVDLEKMVEFYLPPEKILSVSIYNGTEDYVPAPVAEIPKDSYLNDLKDIDLMEAVKNCGGVDVFESVISDFYGAIDSKADSMEEFLAEEDLRNYTVLVHALKSSARLIGAFELSDMAAELEQLGNEENMGQIRQKNPALISKYRSYKESLKAVVKEKQDLPEIPIEELLGAYRDIKELVEAYDFDTADSIMQMLEDYSIPTSAREKHEELTKLIRSVEREKILEML